MRSTRIDCIDFFAAGQTEYPGEKKPWRSENQHLGVEHKTPKWMVKIMENPIKTDDLGGYIPPLFLETPI